MRCLRISLGALGLVGAVTAQSVPASAQNLAPSVAQEFRIGTSGALCEAQGVMLADARGTIFDRKWAIICADISRPVGSAYSLRASGPVEAQLAASRDEALNCGAPSAAISGASRRACTGAETGLNWVSYEATSGETTHVVEGLAAYDSALQLTIASLVADRVVEGEVAVVTTGGSASLAAARAAAGDADALLGQGYRRNNAGEYAEAVEFFQPELLLQAESDPAARALRLHEVTVNRALQHSNMGEFDQALRLFNDARTMAAEDPIQTRLSRNFEALDALNRGALTEARTILEREVPPIRAADLAQGSIISIEPDLANRINAGSSVAFAAGLGQDTRLSLAERAAIIDAQARQIGGTAMRLSGDYSGARAQLRAAETAMLRVREGRVLTIARLRAQILSEIALSHEAEGDHGAAEARLAEALQLIALRYPESASLNAARARMAGFYARRGRTDAALNGYREIVAATIGDSGALVGMENQMRPYFRLLVRELPRRPELINDLFLASQLVERPGAAQTLSQLTRELAAGDGEAAELFRRANAVARESQRNRLSLVQARAALEQGGDPARIATLEAERDRLSIAQAELASALSAYPEYRSVTRSYVSAEELRQTLRADEAYLKLARLGDEYFVVYFGPDGESGWRVDGIGA